MLTPATLRQLIALHERRIRELEADLLHTLGLVHEDSLTHLLDRCGFQEACTLLSAGATGHDATITCAMIQLDYFKMINDRHGVVVADRALLHFSDVLRMHLRPIDQAARVGSDEFALLLFDATAADTMDILTRLLAILAERPVITDTGFQSLHFTAGVAQLRPAESVHEQCSRAAAMLQNAKRHGGWQSSGFSLK